MSEMQGISEHAQNTPMAVLTNYNRDTYSEEYTAEPVVLETAKELSVRLGLLMSIIQIVGLISTSGTTTTTMAVFSE